MAGAIVLLLAVGGAVFLPIAVIARAIARE